MATVLHFDSLAKNAAAFADNVSCEEFFGMLKRERVYRRCYRSHAEARADILITSSGSTIRIGGDV
ncbi:MAG: hypothetical protein K2X35_15475 [Bryobacteraceae bacterium]|nr:hypothetical protein [Bryobacteraceae bacterium]